MEVKSRVADSVAPVPKPSDRKGFADYSVRNGRLNVSHNGMDYSVDFHFGFDSHRVAKIFGAVVLFPDKKLVYRLVTVKRVGTEGAAQHLARIERSDLPAD